MKKVFFMTLSFFVAIFIALTLTKQFRAEDKGSVSHCQVEIRALDRQIYELKNMRQSYLSRATKHENQAQRLKLTGDKHLTAKRYLELAKENLQIAEKIDEDVLELEKKRKNLMLSFSNK